MTPIRFSDLGLSPEILKAIEHLGFEQASPIQAAAIPLLMQGKDVVGQSQTGSGKTAAFAIPALERSDPTRREVQVLVLCPTRELAVQVSEEFHKLTRFKRGLHALPIYGGQSYDRQLYGLKQGVQVVIGTPGRVLDHLRRGTLRLDAVRMAVLDEVDVMLNMGFREDIELILDATAKSRQTVFFSATIPKPIQGLIEKHARDPQQVRIEQRTMTVPTVEQVYYEVDRRAKVDLLTRLIDLYDLKLGIVFCNTKRMVDELVDHLEAQGYQADRLHGDMSQVQRDRVMNRFRKSGLEFLVATDIAARGIDVDDIQVVFNYDLPYDGEDYVHRIGRTGRAGRAGRAISFASGRELFQIRNIERYTNTRIQRARIPTEAEIEEARETVFLDRLRATLKSGEYTRDERVVEHLLEEGFNSTDLVCALIHLLKGESEAAARPAPERSERPERGDRRPDRGPASFQGRPYAHSDSGPHADRGSHEGRSRRAAEGFPRSDSRSPGRPGSGPPDRARGFGGNAPQTRPVQGMARPARPARASQPQPQAQPRSVADETGPVTAEAAPVAVQVVQDAPAQERGSAAAPAAAFEPPVGGEAAPMVAALPGAAAAASEGAASDQNRAEVRVPKVGSTPTAKPLARVKGVKPGPPWARGPGIEKRGGEKEAEAGVGALTRLHLNVGETAGVRPADVVQAICGATGLPAQVVGKVDIRERHLFVEVATAHERSILSRLNRAQIQGRKVKAKLA